MVDHAKNRKEAGLTKNMGKYIANGKLKNLLYRVSDPTFKFFFPKPYQR